MHDNTRGTVPCVIVSVLSRRHSHALAWKSCTDEHSMQFLVNYTET